MPTIMTIFKSIRLPRGFDAIGSTITYANRASRVQTTVIKATLFTFQKRTGDFRSLSGGRSPLRYRSRNSSASSMTIADLDSDCDRSDFSEGLPAMTRPPLSEHKKRGPEFSKLTKLDRFYKSKFPPLFVHRAIRDRQIQEFATLYLSTF